MIVNHTHMNVLWFLGIGRVKKGIKVNTIIRSPNVLVSCSKSKSQPVAAGRVIRQKLVQPPRWKTTDLRVLPVPNRPTNRSVNPVPRWAQWSPRDLTTNTGTSFVRHVFDPRDFGPWCISNGHGPTPIARVFESFANSSSQFSPGETSGNVLPFWKQQCCPMQACYLCSYWQVLDQNSHCWIEDTFPHFQQCLQVFGSCDRHQ